MVLQTKLGEIQVRDEDIITFPNGILGFADYCRYIIIEQDNSIFRFLQSVDEPELTFVMVFPELISSKYSVFLNDEQTELLQLKEAEDGRVYAIVTVPENAAEMTVNLQAPIVVNVKDRVGAQIVLMDGKYHTRHNVLAEMQVEAYLQNKQIEGQDNLRKTV